MNPGDKQEERYAVFLVRSAGYAYRMEKTLAQAGIPCKLIPVPRHLGSDCGICVRVERDAKERSIAVLTEANSGYESVHDL